MMTSLYLAGRLFFLFGVLLLTGLALDGLLLKSDLRSLLGLFVILLGGAAVLAVLSGAAISVCLRLVGREAWIDRVATAAPVAVSLGAVAAIFGQPVLRKLDMGWVLPWIWIGATVLYQLLAGRKVGPSAALNRVGLFSLCGSLILVPVTVSMFAASDMQGSGTARPPDGKSGLLLVVVDALGAEFISGLNDDSPIQTPNIDALLARSTTFPNAHANMPNTHGAFRSLYTGQILEQRAHPTPNLIGDLQREGVNVRIIASHMNALPDNKFIHYRGLRSLLLTQNYSWLPRLAGLDYHLMTYLDTARDNKVKGRKSDRLAALRGPLNSWQNTVDPFAIAHEELDEVMDDERPFLLILHLFFNDTMATLSKPQTINLHPDRSAEEREATNQAIRDRSYRYTDEEAWWAAEYRAAYIDGVRDFDLALGKFIESLAGDGRFDDLDLILMSDHGSSSQDNVLWYGFHAHEATTRIPMLVYREGDSPSRDMRPSSTVDVTATVRDWFGVEGPGEGRSLLSNASGEPALCFTRRDHEDIARVISWSSDRKDLFEVDLDLNVTWKQSYAIGADGSVTDASATPADPDGIAARIEEYCTTRGCF